MPSSFPTNGSRFDTVGTQLDTEPIEGELSGDATTPAPEISTAKLTIGEEVALLDTSTSGTVNEVKVDAILQAEHAQSQPSEDALGSEGTVTEDDMGGKTASRVSRLESGLESLETIPTEITITPSEERPSLSRLQSIRSEERGLRLRCSFHRCSRRPRLSIEQHVLHARCRV